MGQASSLLPVRALVPGTRGMEECGAALGHWLRLLRRQLVTGIFHRLVAMCPAGSLPGDSPVTPQEPSWRSWWGKIRSDVSLWARGMESLGPFWWLSSLGEGTARLAVAVGPRGAQHHLGCGE